MTHHNGARPDEADLIKDSNKFKKGPMILDHSEEESEMPS